MKVSYISLAVSLAAIGWGLLNQQRARAAEGRLDTIRSSHYRLAEQVRREHESLQQEITRLKAQWRQVGVSPTFHAEMTVREAIELEPRAADVMAAFHIGGCSSCAVDATDTLQYAAVGNGQSVEQLLEALNALSDSDSGRVDELLERRPNVEIVL